MSVRDQMVGRLLASSARFLSGTQARWVDCEPSTRQRVYYANHSSHLDILIIWASLPSDVRRLTRPVAARDYWETSALRHYLVHRVFQAIMIDRPGHGAGFRAAHDSIEATLAGIGTEYSVIIFPEGTRGDGEALGPFKSGLYHIAKGRPGIELVPVFMENLNRILPKGELVPAPLLSSVSFGKPLTLGPNEGKQEFLDRARNAILQLKEI